MYIYIYIYIYYIYGNYGNTEKLNFDYSLKTPDEKS